jgi:large subunit ribosomal protein L7/L12
VNELFESEGEKIEEAVSDFFDYGRRSDRVLDQIRDRLDFETEAERAVENLVDGAVERYMENDFDPDSLELNDKIAGLVKDYLEEDFDLDSLDLDDKVGEIVGNKIDEALSNHERESHDDDNASTDFVNEAIEEHERDHHDNDNGLFDDDGVIDNAVRRYYQRPDVEAQILDAIRQLVNEELDRRAPSTVNVVQEAPFAGVSGAVTKIGRKFSAIWSAVVAPVNDDAKYNVVLAEIGASKIMVIKATRQLTSLGLKESKDMVETPRAIIRREVTMEEAMEAKKALEAAGARVEIRQQ